MDSSYPDPLVVMALEQESAGHFEGIPVLYTGVGKINATCLLTRRLERYSLTGRALPLVINFGTAGSPSLPAGSLVCCTKFVQRDMDVTALGFERCATPFESGPHIVEFPALVDGLPTAVCGTGDSFSTDGCPVRSDVVDMEAYALAKVCRLYGAKFGCVKYISDGSDADAAKSWEQNVSAAAKRFAEIYFEVLGRRGVRRL